MRRQLGKDYQPRPIKHLEGPNRYFYCEYRHYVLEAAYCSSVTCESDRRTVVVRGMNLNLKSYWTARYNLSFGKKCDGDNVAPSYIHPADIIKIIDWDFRE